MNPTRNFITYLLGTGTHEFVLEPAQHLLNKNNSLQPMAAYDALRDAGASGLTLSKAEAWLRKNGHWIAAFPEVKRPRGRPRKEQTA